VRVGYKYVHYIDLTFVIVTYSVKIITKNKTKQHFRISVQVGDLSLNLTTRRTALMRWVGQVSTEGRAKVTPPSTGMGLKAKCPSR